MAKRRNKGGNTNSPMPDKIPTSPLIPGIPSRILPAQALHPPTKMKRSEAPVMPTSTLLPPIEPSLLPPQAPEWFSQGALASFSVETASSRMKIGQQIYGCSEENLMILVLYPGDKRCFFGVCNVQALAGVVSVDGYTFVANAFDKKKMHQVCAPYRFGRPAVFEGKTYDATVAAEKDSNNIIISPSTAAYNYQRLRYRLKDITPHYEQIMQAIVDRAPAVLVIDKAPSMTVRVMDQVMSDLLVPPLLRDNTLFDRSAFFPVGCFRMYTKETQDIIEKILEKVDAKRRDGRRCVMIPAAGKGAGKSSLVRYLTNRSLNKDMTLYILDADIGQTEFTPAGCMSLWKITQPILAVPCVHQKFEYPMTYFYGHISPSDDVQRYFNIFDRLYNEFNTTSPPGALLLINTMGWIDGKGLDIMNHIFDVTRPQVIFQMESNRGLCPVPSYVPTKILVKTAHTPGTYVAEPVKSSPKPPALSPFMHRDLSMLAHFVPMLHRPILAAFSETAPYKLKFESAIFSIPEDLSYVDDKYFFGTLNAQIVAMCGPANESDDFKFRRILNDPSLPQVCIQNSKTPLLRCYGYAVIRGIDLETQCIYIMTPLTGAELTKSTIMARGIGIQLPQPMISHQVQTEKNIPYLSKPTRRPMGKNALMTDLYGALRNTTQFKRGFFPQSAHSQQ